MRLLIAALLLAHLAFPARSRHVTPNKETDAMAEIGTPHFHNQPGLPSIKVRAKEFMCIGALPPFDHPHIFIDMGDETDIVCSYCSTRFVHDGALTTPCAPLECYYMPKDEAA